MGSDGKSEWNLGRVARNLMGDLLESGFVRESESNLKEFGLGKSGRNLRESGGLEKSGKGIKQVSQRIWNGNLRKNLNGNQGSLRGIGDGVWRESGGIWRAIWRIMRGNLRNNLKKESEADSGEKPAGICGEYESEGNLTAEVWVNVNGTWGESEGI